MGEVIFVSFGRRKKITRRAWLDGATRCEREASQQAPEIARTLRRCAAEYRRKAEDS